MGVSTKVLLFKKNDLDLLLHKAFLPKENRDTVWKLRNFTLTIYERTQRLFLSIQLWKLDGCELVSRNIPISSESEFLSFHTVEEVKTTTTKRQNWVFRTFELIFLKTVQRRVSASQCCQPNKPISNKYHKDVPDFPFFFFKHKKYQIRTKVGNTGEFRQTMYTKHFKNP